VEGRGIPGFQNKRPFSKKSFPTPRLRDVTTVTLEPFFPDPVTQWVIPDPLGFDPLGARFTHWVDPVKP